LLLAAEQFQGAVIGISLSLTANALTRPFLHV